MGTATLKLCGLLLWPSVATITGPEVAPSGTRVTRNASELTTMGASKSPNFTLGRRSSCGRSPDPMMRTSPPARAHEGATESMRGPPLTFFLPRMRSENPMNEVPNIELPEPGVASGITLLNQSGAEVALPPERKVRLRRHRARFRCLREVFPVGELEEA